MAEKFITADRRIIRGVFDSNGTGTITIMGSSIPTTMGHVIKRAATRERFFLLDHDLGGLQFRARPTFSVGVAKINASASISRLPSRSADFPGRPVGGLEVIAKNIPAVLERSEGGQHQIAIQGSEDVRRADRLVVAVHKTTVTLMVTGIDRATWDGALTIIHAIADVR